MAATQNSPATFFHQTPSLAFKKDNFSCSHNFLIKSIVVDLLEHKFDFLVSEREINESHKIVNTPDEKGIPRLYWELIPTLKLEGRVRKVLDIQEVPNCAIP